MKNNTNNAPSNASSQAKPMGRFEKLFSNRWFAMAVSAMLAVLLWLVVIAQEPTQTRTITVSGVSYDYNSALYTGASLDIVKREDTKVSVVISGDSSAINEVDPADIVVYPDYTEVSRSGMPGEYTLRLQARRADTSLTKFDIDSISPAYVDVTFAQIGTQKFTVEVEASVDPAEGYYLGEKQASPAEVTLRGPESQMSQVDKVVANVALSGQRTESALATAQLEFWDKDGNVLTDTHITADTEQVEVTIPVLKMKEVPITFEYTGVPQGYDTSVLDAQLSQETILIAGPAERVDALESVSAGFVDLTKFKLGETVTLSITLPEGIRNLDALQSVDVTFDTYGFATRTVTVSKITVVNAPSDTTVTVTTRRLSDVTLVGPEDELDALSEANVVAQVDASASNINVSKGQQSMPVTIVVPGSSTVFATGSYEVLCDIDTSEGAG